MCRCVGALVMSLSFKQLVVYTMCRLESILSSLSMKKFSKPLVLVRPNLELKFQSQFSDLSLVSEEGEGIPCHRCVLVARSGVYMHVCICSC